MNAIAALVRENPGLLAMLVLLAIGILVFGSLTIVLSRSGASLRPIGRFDAREMKAPSSTSSRARAGNGAPPRGPAPPHSGGLPADRHPECSLVLWLRQRTAPDRALEGVGTISAPSSADPLGDGRAWDDGQMRLYFRCAREYPFWDSMGSGTACKQICLDCRSRKPGGVGSPRHPIPKRGLPSWRPPIPARLPPSRVVRQRSTASHSARPRRALSWGGDEVTTPSLRSSDQTEVGPLPTAMSGRSRRSGTVTSGARSLVFARVRATATRRRPVIPRGRHWCRPRRSPITTLVTPPKGGAAAKVLRLFFHDDAIAFSTCSFTLLAGSRCGEPGAILRTFARFSEAEAENGVSRIFVGFPLPARCDRRHQTRPSHRTARGYPDPEARTPRRTVADVSSPAT
jgi:hypothetical protein